MSKRNSPATRTRFILDANGDSGWSISLTAAERVLLVQPGVLPGEGSFVTIKTVRELRNVLELDKSEIAAYGIPIEGPITFAQLEPIPAKEIKIGPVERAIVGVALKALDKAEKLNDFHFPLFEKFGVEPAGPNEAA